jgi:hypothetical protein
MDEESQAFTHSSLEFFKKEENMSHINTEGSKTYCHVTE